LPAAAFPCAMRFRRTSFKTGGCSWANGVGGCGGGWTSLLPVVASSGGVVLRRAVLVRLLRKENGGTHARTPAGPTVATNSSRDTHHDLIGRLEKWGRNSNPKREDHSAESEQTVLFGGEGLGLRPVDLQDSNELGGVVRVF